MRLLVTTVTRVAARPLLSRVGPAALLVLFVAVQGATMIPWGAWAAWLHAHPSAASAIGVGSIAAWQVVFAGALRAATLDEALAPIWRAGLGPWRRGLAVSPALAVAAAPPLAFSVLFPGLIWPPFAARVATAIVLGALAMHSSARWVVPAVAAALAFVEPRVPGVVLLVGAVPLAGRVHASASRQRIGVRPTGGRVPTRPLSALVWRDLVAVWRTAPAVFVASALVAAPAAALIAGFRRNGTSDGGLGAAAAILGCAVSPVFGVALGRLRVALGPSFHLRRWPIDPGARVASLLLVMGATFLPSGAAMAAALADHAGPTTIAPMGLAALGCAAGAVWLGRRDGGATPFPHGRSSVGPPPSRC